MNNVKKYRAFTLSEVLIACSVLGLLMAGVLIFYVTCLKVTYGSAQQMKLVGNMRNFTKELIYTASRSHETILYKSSLEADRPDDGTAIADATGRLQTGEDTTSTTDDTNPVGDFVVFIYYELPKPAAQTKYRILKIVGYYVDPTTEALMRITVDKITSPSTDTVEKLLIDNWSTAPKAILTPKVRALALPDVYTTTTTPRLFYRRTLQNIAACGQFFESQNRSNVNTNSKQTYTSSFYFTVTVRS